MARPQAADGELPTGGTVGELMGPTPTLWGVFFVLGGIDRLVWLRTADRTDDQKTWISIVMIAAIVIGAALIAADIRRRARRIFLIPTSNGVVVHTRGARIARFGPEHIERDDDLFLRGRAVFLSLISTLVILAFLRDASSIGLREVIVGTLAVGISVSTFVLQAFGTVIWIPCPPGRRKLRIWGASRMELTA